MLHDGCFSISDLDSTLSPTALRRGGEDVRSGRDAGCGENGEWLGMYPELPRVGNGGWPIGFWGYDPYGTDDGITPCPGKWFENKGL